MSLFGRSEEELDRLRAAVRMLGTTSVPGLSAALSWREHKTEKVLALELGRPGTSVEYDPGLRMVRWSRPPEEPAQPAGPPPARTPPSAPSPSVTETIRPAPTVFRSGGFKSVCPTCHVALLPTGSASLSVCPECGRLSSEGPADAPAPAPEGAPTTPPTGDGGSRAPSALTDRRSQEMFAAYVASKPIPCPKCRTPLRHRGVSEYGCPTCGQLIRFPQSLGPGAVVTAPPLPQP